MTQPTTVSCPPPSISELTREEQARALCLRLLTARARTRDELETQLTKRGYSDGVRARVLDRLVDVGLVDDSEFAEQWVRSRRMHAGKGKRVLAAELCAKGVDSAVIASVLDDIDPAAERECAERLVRARLRRGTLDDDTRTVGRLMAMLLRRGYGQAMAYEVVSAELIAERERRRV